MLSGDTPPDIFDRVRRRALRERAGRGGGTEFMWSDIADDVSDRLVDVSRTFHDVLIIGPLAAYAERILQGRNANVILAVLSDAEKIADDDAVIEEDRLPFAASSFDLVISAGSLDSVNDLTGALIQIRRCLRPDGLFLGHMFGSGTLATLKAVMLEAHEGSAAAQHIHPQIDLRSAADLLSRAGFAMPVVDVDTTTVRYRDWRRLVGDLRNMGIGNALAGPRRYIGRGYLGAMEAAWNRRMDDDSKVGEQFIHINMSGWAPSEQQPKAAKRGSGRVSLAAILPTTQPGEI